MKHAVITMALFLAACGTTIDGGEGEQGPPGERGERGAQGKPGAAMQLRGYTVIASAFVQPGEVESLYAQCEEGDLLTGGHCQVMGDIDGNGVRTELVQSGPVASGGNVEDFEPDGWWGFVRGMSAETEGENAFCYAICLER